MTQNNDATARNLHGSQPKSPIRLVLVEDHVILRQGVKALLELQPDVLIVGEYGCVQSSLDRINALRPDLILVDLALPNGSGLELLAKIRRLSPRSRKLVLTGSDQTEYIRAAFAAGACRVVNPIKEIDVMRQYLRAAASAGGQCGVRAARQYCGARRLMSSDVNSMASG